MTGSPVDCPSTAPRAEWTWKLSRKALFAGSCRYFSGAVLLMAAVTKITALPQFNDHLLLHSGLPSWLAHAVGLTLPWLELTCGFCLLFRMATREAAALGVLMLSVFTLFLLFHPPETDCGCLLFPQVTPPALFLPTLLLRNGLTMVCCLYLSIVGSVRS
jgi:uncharacterized membrane protein YphA (DoxX/SURF4 family)